MRSRTKVITSLTWLFWLPLSIETRGDRANLTDYCLPPADAAINAIRLDAPRDSVLKWLGQPEESPASAAEGAILSYRTVHVEIGPNGRVVRILTTHPGSEMPNGVRVGQSLEEVLERLKAPDSLEELEEVTWSPLVCEDAGSFDREQLLPEVTFTWAPVAAPNNPARPLVQERRLAKIELALRHR